MTEKKPNNIYQKLSNIQSNSAEVLKDKINTGQAYKYFTEHQVLSFLKPLLGSEKLSIKFEDLPELEYKVEKVEREWVVQYWKQATLFNCEDVNEKLEIKFLALGKNPDIAKAKGSAETYAIKYFLMKTFMVPAADNLDPDKEQFSSKENEKKTSSATSPATARTFNTIPRCAVCKITLRLSKSDEVSETFHCPGCNKDTTLSKKR